MKKYSFCVNLIILIIFFTATRANAQNDLDNFYRNFRRKFLPNTQVKINTFDRKNGFIAFCTLDGIDNECSLSSENYDIAMWVSNTGVKIFGVYKYYCGGEGCWGSLRNLAFYNANLQDITSSVVDLGNLEGLAARATIRTYDGTILDVPPQERSAHIEIPRVGTTIKLLVGVPGVSVKHFANMNYNVANGKFTVVAIR